MIEVVIMPVGDSAEAETPEEARYAARVLMSEAADHGAASRFLRATFFDEAGKVLRQDVRKAEL